MTTSGTVAQTVFDTATLIETAFRRCKVHPSKQTPEKIQIAQNCLYLLLSSLGNLGLNLWAVEKQYIGIQDGQGTYQLPEGTIDLLNLIYSTPTRITGTDSSAATTYTTQLSSANTVIRAGVKFSAVSASDTVLFQSSADGITWTTAETLTKTNWATGQWYWFDVDPAVTNLYFRVSTTNPITVSDFYLATAVRDLPVTQWNRDTWSLINNKYQKAQPSTNYYFEKLLRPQFTLWPVPNNNYDHATVFIHRQVQDVGTLIQSLEIPQRWFEAICWQLALRLAFELDGVDAGLIPVVQQMCEKYTLEVEASESDGAPLYLVPTIGAYTK